MNNNVLQLILTHILGDKIKRSLLLILLKIIKFLKISGSPLNNFFYWLWLPFSYLYKLTLKYPFLFFYQIVRKIRKLVTRSKNKNQSPIKDWLKIYSPLTLLIVIGLSVVISNLQAEDIRPDNYGQKNLLYKIAKISEEQLGQEVSDDIVEEGPLVSNNTPTSYLAGEALTAGDTSAKKSSEGIGSLVATTQNESALISPEITDPDSVVKKQDEIIDYVIQAGDTISTIADRFGVSTNTILWENNLTAYSTIKPGQTLKILPVSGLSHTIKSGETLRSIANKYKVEADSILEFNKLASADNIQINQQLLIPGGKKESPVQKVASVGGTPASPSYSIKNIISPSASPSTSKLQWPTNSYSISQYYGWRHTGVDITNKTGQPIYAAEDGTVITSGWNNGGYGYYVIIDHGNGLTTLYAHMSKIYAEKGQEVSRGTVLGAIGSTGRSTGPHLHFEVRSGGSRLNPLGYIR